MKSLRAQRGSMAITLALLLLGLITMLGLVEIGYLYWAHRDVQKVADLAALSGAQRLDECSPAHVSSVAIQNATVDNHFSGDVAAKCGYWSPSEMPAPSYFGDASESRPANAVSVTASLPLTPFFGFAKFNGVSADAIATQSDPVAAFSVGSQLLELHDKGIVPELLQVLGLKVGGTALVGYNGLANLRITPAGLLRQLCTNGVICIDVTTIADIGTLNTTLAAKNVSIGDLIHAVADILDQRQLAGVDVEALNTLATDVELKSLGPVQLGTAAATGTARGLFAYINTATVQSALNAQVDVLDILNTSLQVANSRHLIDLTSSGGLPGVTLLGGVKIWTTVIEPPSIAIGGPGATAYTAQIRIGVRITTGAIDVLGPVLSLLGTSIDIPLVIDVVNGEGVLQGKGSDNKQLCDHDALGPYATIKATSQLLNICISDFDPQHLGSTSEPCQEDMKNVTLVKLLNIDLISGSTHIWGVTGEKDLDLHVGETKSANIKLDVGSTVDNIVKGVLQLLAGQEVSNSSGTQHSNQPVNSNTLAQNLWDGQATNSVNCAALDDGYADASERLACRKAVFQTIHDNAELEPDTAGLLPGVINLVDGLVDSLGGLLNDVGGIIFGNGCGSGLFGGGKVSSCVNDISGQLAESQTSDGKTESNALLALLGPVLNVLKPVLDSVGTQLLEPLVKLLLGNDIGRTDVHLMSLQCKGTQLVY